jgi:hypothetical protein
MSCKIKVVGWEIDFFSNFYFSSLCRLGPVASLVLPIAGFQGSWDFTSWGWNFNRELSNLRNPALRFNSGKGPRYKLNQKAGWVSGHFWSIWTGHCSFMKVKYWRNVLGIGEEWISNQLQRVRLGGNSLFAAQLVQVRRRRNIWRCKDAANFQSSVLL